MSHHRRLEEPERFYLISNRTRRGQFLFRPDDECCRIIKGCLAREVARKNVRLVAYCFPSNHYHLVAGFPEANRAAFMRDFQGELSRRLTDYRDYRETLFPEAYHPQALLDPEALLDAIGYTVNNTVRHGLVTHPEAWPGPGSIDRHRTETPLTGRWLDYNRWHNYRRRQDPPPRSEAMIEYAVDLHVPECLPGDNSEERRHTMLKRIERDRKRFCQKAGLDRHRRETNPSRYKRVDWRTRQSIDENWWDTCRVCAGTAAGAVASYLDRRREIDNHYRAAAEAWKDEKEAIFPVGTYPPGRAQCVDQLEERAPPKAA